MTPAVEGAQVLPIYEGRGLVWMLQNKYDEAIADFQMMLHMARALGNRQQEGASLCHLALAHFLKVSYEHIPFVEQYAQEAMDLSQHTGDQKVLTKSLTSLGLVQQIRGNMQEADRHFHTSLQISRREGYQDALVQNLLWLGLDAQWQGHFPQAIAFCREGATVSWDIHDGHTELFCLAFLCLACWSAGHYAQALQVVHEGMTKAREREHQFVLSRLTNTLGWFHRECSHVSCAVELDHESLELGHRHRIPHVEISALVNLGHDYLALGQHERAHTYFESTLDRVQREAFGSHRWRWQIKLLIGLAELSYTTGTYDQAFRYVEEGLQEAQRTSSQKYVALGWALRGKIIAKLGDTNTAGTELQRAFTLAEQLQSPSLIYPIAYDLGLWHENTGKEREAAALYGKAKATIAQMATAVEDEALRSTFLQSALVQEIHDRAARLGG
jgi:tetratricopeptide (TPR) repeat protein